MDTLKQLPSDTVSCCVTSPPYWALRDYGTDGVVWDGDADCEHAWNEEIFNQHSGRGDCQKSGKYSQQENIPDKQLTRHVCQKCGAWKGQLGLEPDFNLYIKHLCDIFDEVKRVLRKDGTCWVNLGDTYYTKSGSNFQQSKTMAHKMRMQCTVRSGYSFRSVYGFWHDSRLLRAFQSVWEKEEKGRDM